jgi:hypothetical protein
MTVMTMTVVPPGMMAGMTCMGVPPCAVGETVLKPE